MPRCPRGAAGQLPSFDFELGDEANLERFTTSGHYPDCASMKKFNSLPICEKETFGRLLSSASDIARCLSESGYSVWLANATTVSFSGITTIYLPRAPAALKLSIGKANWF